MNNEVKTTFPEKAEFKDKVIFRKNTEFHGDSMFFGESMFVTTEHIPFKISKNIEEVDKTSLENIIVNLLEHSKKQNKTILKYSEIIEKISNSDILYNDNVRLRTEVYDLQSELDKIRDIIYPQEV